MDTLPSSRPQETELIQSKDVPLSSNREPSKLGHLIGQSLDLIRLAFWDLASFFLDF